MNRVTDQTLALIRQFEGLRLAAYRDAAGVWTIGYGHTAQAGPPAVRAGMEISPGEAEALLRADVEAVATIVRRLVEVPVNDNEFGALVSFAYNVGTGALRGSTLLRRLNDGDRAGAALQFGKWIHGGGRVLPGLVHRREKEKQLFLTAAAFPPPPDIEPAAGDDAVANPSHLPILILAGLAALAGIVALMLAAQH